MSRKPGNQTVVEAIAALRATIDLASNGLVRAHLDDLLAAERALAEAVGNLPEPRSITAEDHDRVREELKQLASSIARCRRLGLALNHFARLASSAPGGPGTYDRTGRAPLDAAVGRLEANA